MAPGTAIAQRVGHYRTLFSRVCETRPGLRGVHLRQIARALAEDSWTPSGATLHIDHRSLALTLSDGNGETGTFTLPFPKNGWPKNGRRIIEIDAVAPFPGEVEPIVRILDELDGGKLPSVNIDDSESLGHPNVIVYKGVLETGGNAQADGAVPIDLDTWRDHLREATPGHAQTVIRDFQERVLKPYAGMLILTEYIPPMMSYARRCEEKFGNVRAAIEVWLTLIDAHEILEEVSPENTNRVVRTLMQATKRYYGNSVPKNRQDMEVPLLIWRSLLERHAILREGPEDSGKILMLTMFSLAKEASDLAKSKEERDFDSAFKIWSTLLDMCDVMEQIETGSSSRLVATMRGVATELTDIDKPPAERDTENGIRIWRTILQYGSKLAPYEPGPDPRGLAKVMLQVAGVALNGTHIENEDNLRFGLQILFSLIEERNHIEPEFSGLVDGAIRLAHLAVVRQSDMAFARVDAFYTGDPVFDAHMHANLFYVIKEFEKVVETAMRCPVEHPLVTSVQADALRRLGRVAESERLANRTLILTGPHPQDYWQALSRARAYTCLANIARLRGDEEKTTTRHYQDAAALARDFHFQTAPKMLSRLAVWMKIHGKRHEAVVLAREALTIDPGHRASIALLAALKS